MRYYKYLIVFFSLLWLPVVAGAQSTLIRANFDIPEAAAQEDYLPGGPGDVLHCNYFQRSWEPVGPTGGWLTFQFVAPNIVNPATPGFQGGNVMEGNSDSSDGTRQGYWVQLEDPITGSFTVEVLFLLRTYSPAYAEYKMQNFVSSFWMPDLKAFEIRTLGQFSDRTIQLMTHDGSVEHNVTSPTGTIQDNTWYHAAMVYDASTENASLYLNGAKIGSASPNWGAFSWSMVCVGAWPNPAGSCRDIDGYIDGFSIRDEVLGPEGTYNFVLPTSYSGTKEWERY